MGYGEENVSNGPAGDIMQASQLARAMVLRWGMSEKVGNIDYSEAAEGFSGADLANLVNEAALAAARVGRRFVTMEDFENAKDKVMMGAERRSMVLTPEQKEKTAYHEAGHAVV